MFKYSICTCDPECKIWPDFLWFATGSNGTVGLHHRSAWQKTIFTFFSLCFPLFLYDWWSKMRNTSQNVSQKFNKENVQLKCLVWQSQLQAYLFLWILANQIRVRKACQFIVTLCPVTASFASKHKLVNCESIWSQAWEKISHRKYFPLIIYNCIFLLAPPSLTLISLYCCFCRILPH